MSNEQLAILNTEKKTNLGIFRCPVAGNSYRAFFCSFSNSPVHL